MKKQTGVRVRLFKSLFIKKSNNVARPKHTVKTYESGLSLDYPETKLNSNFSLIQVGLWDNSYSLLIVINTICPRIRLGEFFYRHIRSPLLFGYTAVSLYQLCVKLECFPFYVSFPAPIRRLMHLIECLDMI